MIMILTKNSLPLIRLNYVYLDMEFKANFWKVLLVGVRDVRMEISLEYNVTN